MHIIEQDAPAQVHKERHLTKPDEANAYLKEVARRAFPAQVKVKTHVHTVAVSDVARSIVDHAPELKPDLIVICTHGRSGLHDLLYGSIAQQVVAMGTIPITELIDTQNSILRIENDPASAGPELDAR